MGLLSFYSKYSFQEDALSDETQNELTNDTNEDSYKPNFDNSKVGDCTTLTNEATKYLGVPYKYGGKTPNSGLDCSGLVSYSLKNVGYTNFPGGAANQYNACEKISKSELRDGDLVFRQEGGRIVHVAIYGGNGRITEAPHTGANVREANLDSSYTLFGRVPGLEERGCG